MITFESYTLVEAQYKPFNPKSVGVANALCEKLTHPDFSYLHIGSTSFGAAGKGIIDISLLYSEGDLANAVSFVMRQGFEPQHSKKPFPASRPRFDIGVNYENQRYQVHIHLIQKGCEEHRKQLLFRDLMRSDPKLKAEYEAKKRQILSMNITDQDTYGKHKGVFVKQIINKP